MERGARLEPQEESYPRRGTNREPSQGAGQERPHEIAMGQGHAASVVTIT